MRRIHGVMMAGVFALAISGCEITDGLTPADFTAVVDVRQDGSYVLAYTGTVFYLPILAERERQVGVRDQDGETILSEDVLTELGKDENVTDLSYVGDGVFKLKYTAKGNLSDAPLGPQGKQPLFELLETTERGDLFFKFFPITKEMEEAMPAKAKTLKGEIILTTELPVVTTMGEPVHQAGSNEYRWKIDGIQSEMAGIVMKWGQKGETGGAGIPTPVKSTTGSKTMNI